MRLVIITPESLQPGEPHVARQMLQLGLKTLHLRKPGATRQQLHHYLVQLGEPWTRCVMLHSHHDLAVEFRVKASGCAVSSWLLWKVGCTIGYALQGSTHMQADSLHVPLCNHSTLHRAEPKLVDVDPLQSTSTRSLMLLSIHAHCLPGLQGTQHPHALTNTRSHIHPRTLRENIGCALQRSRHPIFSSPTATATPAGPVAVHIIPLPGTSSPTMGAGSQLCLPIPCL